MIVYRDHHERLRPAERAASIAARAAAAARAGVLPHDDAVELLIDLGTLESAVADQLGADTDEIDPVQRAFRRAARAVAHLVLADGRAEPAPLRSAAAALATLADLPLPPVAAASIPEGYAYYALFPESYAGAAYAFAEERRPVGAFCLGLRSIGTGLSAMVEAALAARGLPVGSWTLRPHGHPFDRRPRWGEALGALLRRRAAEGWHFLVVDEGPGLSGSSMAGTAAALAALGIPDERIVLLPSWRTDGAGLRSELARARWPRHPQYVASLDDAWRPPEGAVELSAGAWRAHLLDDAADWPAVQPQHERRKYLVADPGPMLLRFAGLGAPGRAAHARAAMLAHAGFTAPVCGLSRGFLATRFVGGTPLTPADADEAFLDHVARYLAHLHTEAPAERSVGFEALREMVALNVGEGLGDEWRARVERSSLLDRAALDGPAVAVDGRMLPHEWLRTADGWCKTDALDHHDDHFLPGAQDVAWDVAGCAVEFALPPAAAEHLARRVASLAGDRALPRRLPFHICAYLAFRLGYARLAHEALGDTADAVRFARLERRYAARLRRLLAAPHGR